MSFVQSLKRMGAVGWIATALCAAFCVQIFIFVNTHTHSVSDMLYGVFPYWVPTFLLWAWIVEHTGHRQQA